MSKTSNAELYKVLLAYPKRESIPYDALAEQFKVKRMRLLALTGALLKGSPKALEELKALGYTLEEAPGWVGSQPSAQRKRGPQREGAEQEAEQSAELPAPLVTEEERRQQAEAELARRNTFLEAGDLVDGSSRLRSRTPARTPAGSAYAPPSAMDAALQLMSRKEDGSSIEFEGRRYTVSRVNGEIKLTPVEYNVVGADPVLAAAMSKAIADSMEVNMLAVAKKVALSPVVVIGHGMVTTMKDEEGTPYFVGDIGDFINWSCDFALRTAFGIRIGVITGAPSLMSAMKARREQMAPKLEMRDIV